MKNLIDYERDKYNIIHKYTGIGENQIGYGRQINDLLSIDFPFHSKWRSLLNKTNKFLEIGVGAGEILKYLYREDMDYWGIDISDYVIDELLKEGLNVKECSCHDIVFPDNFFDVVMHLDGMEHIPVEWEKKTIEEEVRVSRKYIFHSNAMGDAYLDQISKSNGFDGVHVNIKNEEEWDSFYEKNSRELNYKIIFRGILSDTYYIILEKNGKN